MEVLIKKEECEHCHGIKEESKVNLYSNFSNILLQIAQMTQAVQRNKERDKGYDVVSTQRN